MFLKKGTVPFIYMKTGKSDMEHSSDVVLQIFDRLSKRFMKYESTNNDSESTVDYLTKLAGSIGYMGQINGAIHKSFKFERRLKAIEYKLKNTALNMQMFEEAPLKEYR